MPHIITQCGNWQYAKAKDSNVIEKIGSGQFELYPFSRDEHGYLKAIEAGLSVKNHLF